jgi:hypothetical protein
MQQSDDIDKLEAAWALLASGQVSIELEIRGASSAPITARSCALRVDQARSTNLPLALLLHHDEMRVRGGQNLN